MAGLGMGSKNELEDIENGADGDEAGDGDVEVDRSGNYDDPVCFFFVVWDLPV